MPLSVTLLGTGTSAGVPMIACDDEACACRSTDPRDRRDRCALLVRYPDARDPALTRELLIDTAPELRQQAIRAGMRRCDAVLYTHDHMDHVLGIDDLRRFNAAMDAAIPIHAEAPVLRRFGEMFPHIFAQHNNINPSFVPTLLPMPVRPAEPLDLHGTTWTPVRLMHGRLPIVGYRIDHGGASVAYCTDVSRLPPESYPPLAGLDVLILDALRDRHHPTHLTVDQALQIIDELQPKRAVLTHMAHDLVYAELAARLPAGVEPGYDGLSIDL